MLIVCHITLTGFPPNSNRILSELPAAVGHLQEFQVSSKIPNVFSNDLLFIFAIFQHISHRVPTEILGSTPEIQDPYWIPRVYFGIRESRWNIRIHTGIPVFTLETEDPYYNPRINLQLQDSHWNSKIHTGIQ